LTHAGRIVAAFSGIRRAAGPVQRSADPTHVANSDPVRLLQHPMVLLLVGFVAVVAVLLSCAPREAT